MGRFGADRWPEHQSNLIAEYLYGISALPPCGENSFHSILLPLAHRVTLQPDSPQSESEVRYAIYAREQLQPKDFVVSSPSALPADGAPSSPGSCKIPILILYGDDDWISFPGVRKYAQEMQSYDVNTTLRIIPHAGHHLYMDNKDEVMKSIDDWWKSCGDPRYQELEPPLKKSAK